MFYQEYWFHVSVFPDKSFRSSHTRCSVKKGVLRITQNSQENTCAKVSFLIKLQASGQSLFFNKVAGFRHATLLKKRLWHRRFPVNFATTPFLQNTSGQMLLIFEEIGIDMLYLHNFFNYNS